MRRILIVAAMVATVLSQTAAGPGEDPGALAACTRDVHRDFRSGLPPGWTASAGAGERTWERVRDPVLYGHAARASTDATEEVDARLTSSSFVPGERALLRFGHSWALPDGAGGVLELRVEEGSWAPIPPAHYRGGAPRGVLTVDGAEVPAWTGARPYAGVNGDAHPTVDLGAYAGSEIQVRWRLLAAPASPSPPGHWMLRYEVHLLDVADPTCVDGSAPGTSCPPQTRFRFEALPDGWSMETSAGDEAAGWRPDVSHRLPVLPAARVDLTDLGAGIHRLVTPVLRVTDTTRVAWLHAYDLGATVNQAALDVRIEGGPWEPVPAEWLTVNGYGHTTSDDGDAWTGSSYWDHASGDIDGGVDLGLLAGHRVQLAFRLTQGDGPVTTPGMAWSISRVDLLDATPPGPCWPEYPPLEGTSDCLGAVPQHVAPDDGVRRMLRVRVSLDVDEAAPIALKLADPATVAEGQAEMAALFERVATLLEPARRAYEPVGLELALTYELLAPLDDDGTPRERPDSDFTDYYTSMTNPGTYHEELFRLAKEQHGGLRPADADVVYVATDVDLEGAGVADCIGGVADPTQAFAVGELHEPREPFVGTGVGQPSAIIMAHEVGHLFGAEHHAANCAEAAAEWAPALDLTGACTLMSPDVGLAWLRFSTPNALIVRGFAEAHLQAVDA